MILTLPQLKRHISWTVTIRAWQDTKSVGTLLKLWSKGVSHSHSSPLSASRNSSKLPFKCSYHFMSVCKQILAMILWILLSLHISGVWFAMPPQFSGKSKNVVDLKMEVTASKFFTCQSWNFHLCYIQESHYKRDGNIIFL